MLKVRRILGLVIAHLNCAFGEIQFFSFIEQVCHCVAGSFKHVHAGLDGSDAGL
jgi:hypothetical protein